MLALTKGYQRDLTGVLGEVGWWRGSFGDLAAEVLMDDVRKQTKMPDLADPPTPPKT